jgi:hypothetical protein
MRKLIINNKSNAPDSVAITAVNQIIIRGEPFKIFNDFCFGKDSFITVVWQPNKDSDRFTIYNEK